MIINIVFFYNSVQYHAVRWTVDKNVCRDGVTVRTLTARVNDVTQPSFDRLSSLQTQIAQSRPVIIDGLDRISSGLEFIQASLAQLDLPVSLRGDQFVQLNNIEPGVGRLHSSVGLDFMVSASDNASRYN